MKMVKIQFFYRKDTLQIDAVFRNSKTNSTIFKDKTKYVEVNMKTPLYPLSRNHKVKLDPKGKVTGTISHMNPIQPTPSPNPNKEMADLIDEAWKIGIPNKTEALKKAVKHLLGYPEP